VALSVLLNYQVGGLRPFGYHLFNVVVHLLAGLVLFGLVRRTLERDRWPECIRNASVPLSFAVAVIWLVHPLQVQSVTYIIQRCESMMGLFFLLTLYCAARGWDSPRRGWWHLAAIVACILGGASKEVIVAAPFVVILYDWVFLSGSVREILKRRWVLYLALFLFTAFMLFVLLTPEEGTAAGFGFEGITPIRYLLTQPGVLLHYLRLSVWPSPLVLDYVDWPHARFVEDWLPQGLVIVALLIGTGYGLWRRSWLGFVGAWFFLILGPTSSFVPIADVAFEHRMYLPLASVIVLAVFGFEHLLTRLCGAWTEATRQRIAAGCMLALSALLIGLTISRNEDYHNAEAMWDDNFEKRPRNIRVRDNLAVIYAGDGREEKAREILDDVNVGNLPLNNFSLFVRGRIALLEGDYKAAAADLRIAVDTLLPDSGFRRAHLGQVYLLMGNLAEAEVEWRKAVELSPLIPTHSAYLALVLSDLGKTDEASIYVKKALALAPELAEAMLKRSRRLALMESTDDSPTRKKRIQSETILIARAACLLTDYDDAKCLDTLAIAYAAADRFPEAKKTIASALETAKRKGSSTTLVAEIERHSILFDQGKAYTRENARLILAPADGVRKR